MATGRDSLEIVETVEEVRARGAELRSRAGPLAFVATMGNLHAGHMALIDRARDYGGSTLVSLYVNPMQFGPNEDFATYPRTVVEDKKSLADAGVDLLFMPVDETMYPNGVAAQTRVEVPDLGAILEGKTRPTFFLGVTTVVARLLNIVQADVAVFGKKDYQQLTIVKKMVDDLAIPTRITGVETVRDDDGLALSSRNGYLSKEERAMAPGLYKALVEAGQNLIDGERDLALVERTTARAIAGFGLDPDYVSVRTQGDLRSPAQSDSDLVILAAAYVGKTRLIDNLEVVL